MRIIIIGAGPAGLTAAYELLKQSNDVDVTILEESGVIGAFTGGLSATAGGIAAAVFFSLLAAFLFQPGDRS